MVYASAADRDGTMADFVVLRGSVAMNRNVGDKGNHTRGLSHGPQCGPATGAQLGTRLGPSCSVRHEGVWVGSIRPTTCCAKRASINTPMVGATARVKHKARRTRFGLDTCMTLRLKLGSRFRKRGLAYNCAGANGLLHSRRHNTTQGLNNAANCCHNCLQVELLPCGRTSPSGHCGER